MKDIDIGHIDGLIGVVGGQLRREEVCASGVAIGAISMIALLVDVVRGERPIRVESVLNAAGDVDCIGRPVSGVNDVSRAARRTAGNAARVF